MECEANLADLSDSEAKFPGVGIGTELAMDIVGAKSSGGHVGASQGKEEGMYGKCGASEAR